MPALGEKAELPMVAPPFVPVNGKLKTLVGLKGKLGFTPPVFIS